MYVYKRTSMRTLFNNIYNGKKVLVTGHTGFKGSWLSLWLHSMGARVAGYSLAPETVPNHFELLNLTIDSTIGTITDSCALQNAFTAFQPDIVFHLAAQPLVRRSYRDPVDTYMSNVVGTLQVFEAVRKTSSVQALVVITTDKVYDNREWLWGYRESDALGGYDPYSASKACAEIVVQSCRNSFFNPSRFGKDHNVLIASVRAGNVIGGGDWSEDRLIPDLMKSCAAQSMVTIRSPEATRPWQHVIDCLSGYLFVGQKLLEKDETAATAFNFGPSDEDTLTVREVVERVKQFWPAFTYELKPDPSNPHEAHSLKLDCSKAHAILGWKPIWNSTIACELTAKWYRAFYEDNSTSSQANLEQYITNAHAQGALWA